MRDSSLPRCAGWEPFFASVAVSAEARSVCSLHGIQLTGPGVLWMLANAGPWLREPKGSGNPFGWGTPGPEKPLASRGGLPGVSILSCRLPGTVRRVCRGPSAVRPLPSALQLRQQAPHLRWHEVQAQSHAWTTASRPCFLGPGCSCVPSTFGDVLFGMRTCSILPQL